MEKLQIYMLFLTANRNNRRVTNEAGESPIFSSAPGWVQFQQQNRKWRAPVPQYAGPASKSAKDQATSIPRPTCLRLEDHNALC